MYAESTELVQYSKATEIATKYATATAAIRRLALELGHQVEALKAAFQSDTCWLGGFDIQLELQRTEYPLMECKIDKMLAEVERSAWAVLVEKIGVKKFMSAKQREQIEDQLRGSRRTYHNEPPPPLPALNAESIMSVMGGFVQSAPEFLEEKIREVYQWLVPCSWDRGHITNKRDRLGRKVIRTGAVTIGYRTGCFRPGTYRSGELCSLDSVFHALDGKAAMDGHNGPLITAIENTVGGVGETNYFKFKCYKNGNLHLEFKRMDLLEIVNRVAVDGKNIGAEDMRPHSTKRSA